MEQPDNKNDNVFAYLYKSQWRYETHKELLRAEQHERQRKEETFVPTITNLAQSLSKKCTERREEYTFERLHNLHKCKQFANNSQIETLDNVQTNYEQKQKTMSANLHHDNNRNNIPSQIAKKSAKYENAVQEQDMTELKNNVSVCKDNSEVETLSEDCTFKPNITPASEVLSRVYYQQHAMGKLNVYDRLYCPSHSISATQTNSTNAFTPLWNLEENEEYCYSTNDNEHVNAGNQNKRTHGNTSKDKKQNALAAHMYKVDNYLCNDWATDNNNEHTWSHSKNKELQYQPLWKIDASLSCSSKTNNTTHKKTSAMENFNVIGNASRNKSKKIEEVSEETNDKFTFRPCINRTSQELWERKVLELKARGVAVTKSDARRVMEHEAQMRKENEVAAIQYEQNEKEMHECTFQPFVSEHHERELELVQRSHAAGLNREYVHIPFIERTKLYEQQRKNEQDNLRLYYDEELEQQCTFTPNMHNLHKGTKHLCNSKPKKRSSSCASIRLTSSAAAITTVTTSSSNNTSHKISGETKHIERQRSLRHDKAREDVHAEHSVPREVARRNPQLESRKESVNSVDSTLMCEELEPYYPYANNVRSTEEIESNNNYQETRIYENKDDDYLYTYSLEGHHNNNRLRYISAFENNRLIDRFSVLAQRDVNIDGTCHHSSVKVKQKFEELSATESNTLISCTATTTQ